MTNPQEGFRKARAVTAALVVLGVAGTAAGSVLAYTDSHQAASDPVVSTSATEPGPAATGSAPSATTRAAPPLTAGSGRVHGRSAGS
ncbi:hypothetical protein [Prescottella agglutinans]|uniref:CAP domain-containing protein n=1 Tax=Prescottella agglutinans TaxID=1644129 RepID=A0ABT6MH80_9NOCA|nr:hypothetical protein [Prescottella agglutinans]MDH6283642.1 hypothetical protein [Prescottella agglutinans]